MALIDYDSKEEVTKSLCSKCLCPLQEIMLLTSAVLECLNPNCLNPKDNNPDTFMDNKLSPLQQPVLPQLSSGPQQQQHNGNYSIQQGLLYTKAELIARSIYFNFPIIPALQIKAHYFGSTLTRLYKISYQKELDFLPEVASLRDPMLKGYEVI